MQYISNENEVLFLLFQMVATRFAITLGRRRSAFAEVRQRSRSIEILSANLSRLTVKQQMSDLKLEILNFKSESWNLKFEIWVQNLKLERNLFLIPKWCFCCFTVYAWESVRQLAIDNFLKFRPFMHSTTVGLVAKDLKLDEVSSWNWFGIEKKKILAQFWPLIILFSDRNLVWLLLLNKINWFPF